MSFYCPRRDDMLSFAGYSPIFDPEREGPDEWREERNPYMAGPTCSYCRSLSPEALFEAITRGFEIGPTDKGYKLYVEVPSDDPGALRVVAASNGKEPPYPTGCKRFGDLTADERAMVARDGMGVDKSDDYWICFGEAGPTKHGKFYFQHFSKADRERFIELHNADAINFGYPGRLYSLPYFTRVEA